MKVARKHVKYKEIIKWEMGGIAAGGGNATTTTTPAGLPEATAWKTKCTEDPYLWLQNVHMRVRASSTTQMTELTMSTRRGWRASREGTYRGLSSLVPVGSIADRSTRGK